MLDQMASDPNYKSEKSVPITVEYCKITNHINVMSKNNPVTTKNNVNGSDTRKSINCASKPTGSNLTGPETISIYCTCLEQIYNQKRVNQYKSHAEKQLSSPDNKRKPKRNTTGCSSKKKRKPHKSINHPKICK